MHVSFGSELGNRAPAFDMDLYYLMDGGKLISYEKPASSFLKTRHRSVFWLPEGKGVSSSAAIEAATMSAMAAYLGLDTAFRDLALLYQKVENQIVGAPCGMMYQMASVCGEENNLLAILCQPAEVLGHVDIPPHILFWGIDSGIRHSYTYVLDLSWITRATFTHIVQAPTRHPIYENFESRPSKHYCLLALGELVYQCHYSYSSWFGWNRQGGIIGTRNAPQ